MIKAIEFPRTDDGGMVQINYPFTFAPPEAPAPAEEPALSEEAQP